MKIWLKKEFIIILFYGSWWNIFRKRIYTTSKRYIITTQLNKNISLIFFFFIFKIFYINLLKNITQYFDAILEKMELDLTILLMQEVFNYQELFIILVSIE